jgi:hypothetical protein
VGTPGFQDKMDHGFGRSQGEHRAIPLSLPTFPELVLVDLHDLMHCIDSVLKVFVCFGFLRIDNSTG